VTLQTWLQSPQHIQSHFSEKKIAEPPQNKMINSASYRPLFLFVVAVFVLRETLAQTIVDAVTSYELLPVEDVPLRTYPPVNVDKAIQEDTKQEQQGPTPYRFAVPNADFVTPATHGIWESPKPGIMIWRLRLQSLNAQSINMGFTMYYMPEGGQLSLFDHHQQPLFRPFTAADNKLHQQLWTPPVPGDTVMLELLITEEDLHFLQLELTSVNVGYRGWELIDNRKEERKLSGSCNVDVACSAADPWRDEIRTAATYIISGTSSCSGGMINQAVDSFSVKPLFLTAYHCTVTESSAPTMVVYWNYETSTCGGTPDGTRTNFQTGAKHRASYQPTDMTLVELDDPPNLEWSVAWAGWDRSDQSSTSAVAIHHPGGGEKRISFAYDATAITSYYGTSTPGDGTHIRVIDWDLGTTEPGSSGSHLFDQNHRVIGQLHGGGAACGNDSSDYYGRLSISWTGGGTASTRLSDWLDPLNTLAWTTNTLGELPLSGACCLGSICSISTQSGCTVGGGFYLGDGASCTSPVIYSSGTLNLNITDNGGPSNAVVHTITVPNSLVVKDVNVLLHIKHTWIGDLIVEVMHSGRTVTIMKKTSCGKNNVNIILDTEGTGGNIQNQCVDDLVSPPNYQSAESLSAFDGTDGSGAWTIKVYDNNAADTGMLVDWAVQIDSDSFPNRCPAAPTQVLVPPPVPTNTPIPPPVPTNTPAPPPVPTNTPVPPPVPTNTPVPPPVPTNTPVPRQGPPINPAPSSVSSGSCFSNINSVEVEGKGFVPIVSLQVGDKVRSGMDGFSRVYSFAHNDHAIEVDYLRIFCQGHTIPLEVSRDHLVYMAPHNHIVRASQIQIGDTLVIDDTHVVERIEHVKRQGAYAPMTESGSIVVSGIRASSYVGLLDHVSPRTHQLVLHAASSTRRIVCLCNFAMCQQETYSHGIADWIYPFIWTVDVLDQLQLWIRMISILIILPVATCFYLVEQVFKHCSAICLVILFSRVVQVRTIIKKH
jgi:subtilisin-like proprotein convertase family protein